MRLRAFVFDKFYSFFKFVGIYHSCVVLSDRDVEKRERLIQTYLIVFGLFLSYDHDLALRRTLMDYFILFLWISLFYYWLLTSSSFQPRKLVYNVTALLIGAFFSSAFVSIALSNKIGESMWFMVLFIYCMTVVFVAFPLFV